MSDYTNVLKDSMLLLVKNIITDRDSLEYYSKNKGDLRIEIIINLYDPNEYARKYLEGLLEVYTLRPHITSESICVPTLITNAISYFLTRYSFVKDVILSTK